MGRNLFYVRGCLVFVTVWPVCIQSSADGKTHLSFTSAPEERARQMLVRVRHFLSLSNLPSSVIYKREILRSHSLRQLPHSTVSTKGIGLRSLEKWERRVVMPTAMSPYISHYFRTSTNPNPSTYRVYMSTLRMNKYV